MGRPRKDYTGIRYGMIEAIEFSHVINSATSHQTWWVIKCDCGRTVLRDISKFKMNKSCGCQRTPKTVEYDYYHPLYKIWISLRARCNNPNDAAYFNYGARGVKVCELWDNNYQPFYDWCIANGWEEGMQIDKDIKGNGLLYSPEWCSVTTRLQNNRSRRGVKLSLEKANEIRNSTLSTRELSEIYGVHTSAINCVKRNKTWV